MHWETVWTFKTATFEVCLSVADEQEDPAGHFCDSRDVDAIRNGDVLWFVARVQVKKNGHVIGSDYLGACSYASLEEFYTSHRDRNPMNRNSSIMRAANGENVCICHYFPSMVHEAIADARRTLKIN
jgi:hypothetical protein